MKVDLTITDDAGKSYTMSGDLKRKEVGRRKAKNGDKYVTVTIRVKEDAENIPDFVHIRT